MNSWANEKTVVRRVRIKGRKLDSLVAQLRLDNILQNAELHPSWLPPSAIVCLRHLRDPLPRTVNLHSRTATQSLGWQQSVSAAVQEKIRRAVRPINAEVPAEATAIIFKDQAELLACLAADWAEDRLGSRWWWRSLFKNQEFPSLAFHEWLTAPQYVPAALELLSLNRKIERFARKISGEQAMALLREVTQCFDLPELQSAFDEGLAHVSQRLAAGETITSRLNIASSDLPDGNPHSHATPPAPWHHQAAESLDQTLGPERQCLIGVALTIRRAPAAARSAHFAQATLSWLRSVRTNKILSVGDSVPAVNSVPLVDSKPDPARGVQTDEDLARDFDTSVHNESRLTERSTATPGDRAAHESLLSEATFPGRHPTPRPATNGSLPDKGEYPPQSTQSRISTSSDLDTRDLDTSVESQPNSAPSTRPQSAPSGTIVTRIREMIAPEPDSIASVTSPGDETSPASLSEKSFFETAADLLELDETRVETEIGGVFYLINLGIFLELYTDFTTPGRKGLALSIFDFIDLVGRRLLDEHTKDDPLWKLLAQLAGREELDDPAQGFYPPDEWRLPAQWLEAFPDEHQLEWMTEDRRLRVRHPAGFLLLDVQLSKNPVKQLKREMMVYNTTARRQLKRKSFSFSPHDSSLQHWLDWLMPYVRVRLCRALGIADASDPALMLCAQRASILLTGVDLDVSFVLSEHPLEIRLAGLDRDPGWVPAAGRFVRFRYR